MNKRRIGFYLIRSFFLIIVFVFCAVNAAKREDAETLSFRLYLPNSSMCIGGAELPLEFELWNLGGADIEVSSTGFGRSISLLALYDTIEGRPPLKTRSIIADNFDKSEPPTRTLKAGSGFRVPGKLTLDKEFFKSEGFYQVSMGYSGYIVAKGASTPVSIHSNDVIFELTSCDP